MRMTGRWRSTAWGLGRKQLLLNVIAYHLQGVTGLAAQTYRLVIDQDDLAEGIRTLNTVL
jgi:hypothetical protein